MKAPKFWYQSDTIRARILAPIGRIYGWSVARRFRKTRPYQAGVPVICVGNLTVGGTGKTPVCLALGEMLKKMGISFFCLNHGYKSQKKGIVVHRSQMTALDVGDEALLLAKSAPTVVDNRRARGAQIAERQGAQAIIMDDGFQNPGLIKTLSLVVVDGKRGFGNGQMIPAGPLREPVEKGLKRADAVIIAGTDETGATHQVRTLFSDMPVLSGHFEPDPKVLKQLKGKPVVAFAGIGSPDKFFDMLTGFGIPVAKKIPFPDHYFYSRFDIEQILSDAGPLTVVTTAKDFVKVPRELQSRLTVISGHFVFDEPQEIEHLLKGTLSS